MAYVDLDDILEGEEEDDFEGDEDDELEGDDLEGDDLMSGDDNDDDNDDDMGARKRRARRARRARKVRKVRKARARKARARRTADEPMLILKFPIAACGIGAAIQLQAQANRDCRPIDLRVEATTAVGVVDPGLQVGDLSVHGKDLSLSGGLVSANFYSPLVPSSFPNCNVPEIIRSGETVTLNVQGISAAATVVSATLYCRAVA